jgi:hypothetical protein
MENKMYCVRCRKKQKCKKVRMERDRRGKERMHGYCSVCRTGCYQYVAAGKSKSKMKSKGKAHKSKSKSKSKAKKSKSKKRSHKRMSPQAQMAVQGFQL